MIDAAATALAEAGDRLARAPTPNCWPRTWPASTAAGWRCSTPDDDFVDRYDATGRAARAARIPLQHLIGTAAFGPVTVAGRARRVHPAAGDRVAAGMGARATAVAARSA